MDISFIILSYNRPVETEEAVRNIIEYLVIPDTIKFEIIIINNNSSVSYASFESYINSLDGKFSIRYILNDENLGVAGGRNQAMKMAKGEIIISLDDDAEFREIDIAPRTISLFEKYKDQNIALLTYKVVERSDGRIDIATKNKSDLDKKEFFTTYFKGGAHAVLKAVVDELDGYKIGGLYGAEEYDLSYRLLDREYRILHTSDISILHKKSPSGREDYAVQMGYLLKNKSILAYQYLPLKYFYTHLFLWTGFFLKKTNFKLFSLIKYIRETLKLRSGINRTPIKQSTIDYIKSIGGRITH